MGLLWLVRESAPFVRSVAVCAGAALSTPYLLDYDMAVVGLGGAFLYAEARRTEFLPFEKSAIAVVWISPWFSRQAAEVLTLPLGVFAMILLAWVAARRARSGHRHPAVHVQRLPGDVSGLAAGEIGARRTDILA
jgi:alpha-1,2-mannosyltransferase